MNVTLSEYRQLMQKAEAIERMNPDSHWLSPGMRARYAELRRCYLQARGRFALEWSRKLEAGEALPQECLLVGTEN
jgi:hypothetical protein